jgi:chaperone modulatory protein CbpM
MTLQFRFRLEEAAQKSGVAPAEILVFISRTWIKPLDPALQVFDEEDVARIQLIHELQDSMGVNDDAVPVIMHLIDQLNRLHLELSSRS